MRTRKVDAIHPGASFSGVFVRIGRGNRDGIRINPTLAPLGVLRVNVDFTCSQSKDSLCYDWEGCALLVVFETSAKDAVTHGILTTIMVFHRGGYRCSKRNNGSL